MLNFINSDYLPFLIFSAFVLSVFGWSQWQFRIQPLRISKNEINGIVDELIAKHGADADEWAAIEEHAAWYRSNTAKQGKWRRIRKELLRRQQADK